MANYLQLKQKITKWMKQMLNKYKRFNKNAITIPYISGVNIFKILPMPATISSILNNKKANNILIPITDRAVKAQHTYLLSILFFILTPQQWRCNRNYYTSNHYY